MPVLTVSTVLSINWKRILCNNRTGWRAKENTDKMDLMKALADREPRNYLAHLRTGWLAYLPAISASLAYYQKAVVLAGDAVNHGSG